LASGIAIATDLTQGGGLSTSGVWSPGGQGAATFASGIQMYNGVPVAGNESSWLDECDTSASVAQWEASYTKTTSGSVGAATQLLMGTRNAVTWTNSGGIVSMQSLYPPVRLRAASLVRFNAWARFDSGSEAIIGLVKVGITTPFTAISDGLWLYKASGSLTPTLYSAHASAQVSDSSTLPFQSGVWHEITIEFYGGLADGRGQATAFLDGHPVATIDGVDICSDQALAVHFALKGTGSLGVEHIGRVVRSVTSK